MSMNHYMTVLEASKASGLSPSIIYGMISAEKVSVKKNEGGTSLVSLDAVKAVRQKSPGRKSKIPGRPGLTESATPEDESEHPLLKAWWTRTILPLLEAQGIRGISWQLGQSPEVELVTKVKL